MSRDVVRSKCLVIQELTTSGSNSPICPSETSHFETLFGPEPENSRQLPLGLRCRENGGLLLRKPNSDSSHQSQSKFAAAFSIATHAPRLRVCLTTMGRRHWPWQAPPPNTQIASLPPMQNPTRTNLHIDIYAKTRPESPPATRG